MNIINNNLINSKIKVINLEAFTDLVKQNG